jgi:hypothetical protein
MFRPPPYQYLELCHLYQNILQALHRGLRVSVTTHATVAQAREELVSLFLER